MSFSATFSIDNVYLVFSGTLCPHNKSTKHTHTHILKSPQRKGVKRFFF